ncbi:hypothetical protein RIB2604_01800650 [Aspergillus luchuensis]|uniref:Uncharacterized protein n=1 Tax=Aspergillus kawachii TaxID=1069201 RepID=A0A146FDV6_ASPKA|nr:hypothetical protein RIB2604_01800650 [Aspergillus luchuensis]
MKKPTAATALFAGAGLTNTTLNCSTEAFQKIVPANASVVLAKRVAENGTFTPPAADTGFPDPAYQLPALCAVQVEMPTGFSGFRVSRGLRTWNVRRTWPPCVELVKKSKLIRLSCQSDRYSLTSFLKRHLQNNKVITKQWLALSLMRHKVV